MLLIVVCQRQHLESTEDVPKLLEEGIKPLFRAGGMNAGNDRNLATIQSYCGGNRNLMAIRSRDECLHRDWPSSKGLHWS